MNKKSIFLKISFAIVAMSIFVACGSSDPYKDHKDLTEKLEEFNGDNQEVPNIGTFLNKQALAIYANKIDSECLCFTNEVENSIELGVQVAGGKVNAITVGDEQSDELKLVTVESKDNKVYLKIEPAADLSQTVVKVIKVPFVVTAEMGDLGSVQRFTHYQNVLIFPTAADLAQFKQNSIPVVSLTKSSIDNTSYNFSPIVGSSFTIMVPNTSANVTVPEEAKDWLTCTHASDAQKHILNCNVTKDTNLSNIDLEIQSQISSTPRTNTIKLNLI